MELGERIDILKRLLYPERLEAVIREEEKAATLKKGLTLMLLVVLLNGIISFSMKMLEAHIIKNTVESLAEEYNVQNVPKVINEQYVQNAALAFLIIGIPLMFIGAFVMQGLTYLVLKKAFGGKGDFATQYYLAANIMLLPSIASVALPLLIFVPCLNMLALLAYMAFGLYVTFYIHGKMLRMIHGVSWAPAIAATLLSLAASGAVYMGVMLLLMQLGLFPETPRYIDVQV